MSYHYTPLRMAKIQNSDNTKYYYSKDAEEPKMAPALWEAIRQFLIKPKHTITIQPRNCTPGYLSQENEKLRSH